MSRLIDADRLLSERMKSKYYHLPNGDIAVPLVDIENAPTIEERKTGRWIGRPLAGYCTVRCSVCGDAFCNNDGRWNYCPNCGAKMEVDDG